MIEKQVEFSLLENGEGNITSLSHQSPQAHNNNPESSHMRRRLPHYHYHKIQGPHKLCQVGSPESEEGDGEHFSSRPIDFTTGRRMSDDSSEGEEEYFR